jgi:phage baseplate assembly protein W
LNRAAFLVDGRADLAGLASAKPAPAGAPAGERIDCLLNPETLELSRDERTELVLNLLFDLDLANAEATDVRAVTGRLWALAETREPVRLLWGKAWNLPGVIAEITERFDAFAPSGVPRRSWLRLKMVHDAAPWPPGPVTTATSAMRFAPALTSAGTLALADGDEAVRQALLLLLSTAPGERVAHPDYGARLHGIPGAVDDDTTAGIAIHYVRDAVRRWEPRVELLDVDAGPDPEAPTRLRIRLDYRIRASGTTASTQLTVEDGT